MNIFHLFMIFLHGAQRAVEKARLPQMPLLPSPAIDSQGRPHLDGLHRPRDGKRKGRVENGVPMIRKKYTSRQEKSVFSAALADHPGQALKFRFIEHPTVGYHATGYEKISVRQNKTP